MRSGFEGWQRIVNKAPRGVFNNTPSNSSSYLSIFFFRFFFFFVCRLKKKEKEFQPLPIQLTGCGIHHFSHCVVSLGRWATWVINWIMRVEESNFLARGDRGFLCSLSIEPGGHLRLEARTYTHTHPRGDWKLHMLIHNALAEWRGRHAHFSSVISLRQFPVLSRYAGARWKPGIMNGRSAKVHVFAVFILFREATLRCLSGGAALICSVNTRNTKKARPWRVRRDITESFHLCWGDSKQK